MAPLRTNNMILFAAGVLALGARVSTAYPSKLVNMLRDPDAVDGDGGCLDGEQYNQIETISTLKDNYDYYTLTWRQVTGACGIPISSSDAAVFSVSFELGEVAYDTQGRDQILMFMCSPYGYYEVEIKIVGGVEGASGDIAWEVEIGPSEEHIWDTWNPEEYNIPKYNPSGPGTYTFPLEGETDSHMALMWAGPDPAGDSCGDGVGGGAPVYTGGGDDNDSSDDGGSGGGAVDSESLGCWEDGADRIMTLASASNEANMSPAFCLDFCAGEGAVYYGVEFGKQCFCSADDSFTSKAAIDDSKCNTPCTGDSSVICGGKDAMNVYEV